MVGTLPETGQLAAASILAIKHAHEIHCNQESRLTRKVPIANLAQQNDAFRFLNRSCCVADEINAGRHGAIVSHAVPGGVIRARRKRAVFEAGYMPSGK